MEEGAINVECLGDVADQAAVALKIIPEGSLLESRPDAREAARSLHRRNTAEVRVQDKTSANMDGSRADPALLEVGHADVATIACPVPCIRTYDGGALADHEEYNVVGEARSPECAALLGAEALTPLRQQVLSLLIKD